MKKSILYLCSLVFAFPVFGSHPHQSVCVVSAKYDDGERLEFLIQTHSERLYVTGDPNTDTHLFKYQVRVCDDNNDDSRCSTYQNKEASTNREEEVTMVGMKDSQKVFFQGTFKLVENTLLMDGKVIQTKLNEHYDFVRVLAPFKIKLDKCISQTWVELKPEADSTLY